MSRSVSGEHYKVKVPDVYSVEGMSPCVTPLIIQYSLMQNTFYWFVCFADHHDAFLMNDCTFESYLSWNTVSHGTRSSWKKEYKV